MNKSASCRVRTADRFGGGCDTRSYTTVLEFGITDHLEGPRDQPSREVFNEIIAQTELADRLGIEYAWFAEHHAHAHHGHLPAPLLLALHLAGRTKQIRLGTAIICLNLHHPLDVAEQCASADLLMNGRSAFGFGSGSTPEEFVLFGGAMTEEPERHARFEQALRLIRAAWRGQVSEVEGQPFSVPAHAPLPVAAADLAQRSWLAANSIGAARIAGAMNFNMLFSHLRTPAQYRDYLAAYRAAGGAGRIAANRPVHVAKDDETAFARAEPALRTLWRRFRAEGKIPADMSEPRRIEEVSSHPINFMMGEDRNISDDPIKMIIGGPRTVAAYFNKLRECIPFDVINVEVRFDGLTQTAIHDCMELLAHEVRPLLIQS